MIDLHTHTTISDGTLTPTELVRRAKERGLRALAVTDHDIVDGVAEAMAVGQALGVRIIAGVEVSADSPYGAMHVLGYFVDYQDAVFQKQLERFRQYRDERNPQIVEKLNRLGMEISYEEVLAKAGEGTVGRPHFAAVLVEKGYVRSVPEAFDKYLKTGAPAYVNKKRPSAAEAIGMIHQAGGLAVLAHPIRLRVKNGAGLNQLVAELTEHGLDGIEVYHSDHPPELVEQLLGLAEKFALVVFGGSDFHGQNKPGIELGEGRGHMRIPESLLEPIERRLRDHRTPSGEKPDA